MFCCVSADQIINKPTLLEKGKLKFLIMDAPTDENIQAYKEMLLKRQVSTVVRTCKPTYETAPLREAKIDVVVR